MTFKPCPRLPRNGAVEAAGRSSSAAITEAGEAVMAAVEVIRFLTHLIPKPGEAEEACLIYNRGKARGVDPLGAMFVPVCSVS